MQCTRLSECGVGDQFEDVYEAMPPGKKSDRICSKHPNRFNNGTVVPYHALVVSAASVKDAYGRAAADEDDDGNRKNDGLTTACEYSVYPPLATVPEANFETREARKVPFTAPCPPGEVCLPRMRDGVLAPLVRAGGRQAITSVCKRQTTTRTSTTTTTKGPQHLFTPNPKSALGKHIAENHVFVEEFGSDPYGFTVGWIEQCDSVADLQERLDELELRQIKQCRSLYRNGDIEKCHLLVELKEAAERKIGEIEARHASYAAEAQRAAHQQTTSIIVGVVVVVVLIMVVVVIVRRNEMAAGAANSHAVISFENPTYGGGGIGVYEGDGDGAIMWDADYTDAGMYNADDGEGLYDEAVFAAEPEIGGGGGNDDEDEEEEEDEQEEDEQEENEEEEDEEEEKDDDAYLNVGTESDAETEGEE